MGLNERVKKLESSLEQINDIDLTLLSDEDLLAIINSPDEGEPTNSAIDFSQYSDDELLSIARGERGLNIDENARAKP